ncbi:fasciclin domain-containing protein [Tenacibaculum agarivorans]|uniref:fasciclin domain-containing protein n=1 Tax=Tenacibaculum agarivorans TaxID=1908389 RepID=UPI00094B8EE9|nr:fasciclin domain-containing protein [Tenacibaculum agarivorans]
MLLKTIKKAVVLSVILGFGFLTSCSDDEDDKVVASNTIVDVASGNNSLSILVQALQKADLVSDLQGAGPFTVFAPSNDAFQALLDSKAAWNSLDDVPVATLKNVLLYHVVATKALSTDLSNGQTLTTLSQGTLTVDTSSGVKITTGAGQSVSVTTPDVNASNGVVHIVDQVFLPGNIQDIADLAVSTPDLSTLVQALTKANLVSAVQADGPFTVFAPTNAAFQALLDSNASWNTLDDIDADLLKNVLLFHVIGGSAIKSTDLSDTYVNTLAVGPNDEPLSLQVETTGAIEFNGDAKPVSGLIDIEATNGVVHVIDKVMLPPNVVTLALNNAGFTSLVAALTDSRHTTDFVSVLSGDGPFTVFAPTNDAFQALLDSNSSWNSLADIPIGTLDKVLKYHVVSGSNVQADQLMNGDVTTLGGTITVDLTNGPQIKTETMQTVNILVGAATNDVQGTNGVVHAVDAVLVPTIQVAR